MAVAYGRAATVNALRMLEGFAFARLADDPLPSSASAYGHRTRRASPLTPLLLLPEDFPSRMRQYVANAKHSASSTVLYFGGAFYIVALAAMIIAFFASRDTPGQRSGSLLPTSENASRNSAGITQAWGLSVTASASLALASGKSVCWVADQLGHADPALTLGSTPTRSRTRSRTCRSWISAPQAAALDGPIRPLHPRVPHLPRTSKR